MARVYKLYLDDSTILLKRIVGVARSSARQYLDEPFYFLTFLKKEEDHDSEGF